MNKASAYAAPQIPRIARERGLSADAVRTLVSEHTELNLALDAR